MSGHILRSPRLPSSWWRTIWARAVGVGVIVVALVAAVLVGMNHSVAGSGRLADLNRAPFDAALIRLASTPALHYRTSLAGGLSTMDVRTTSKGESVGTVTVAGQKFGVLTVGGRTYVKPPEGFLPPGSGGAGTAAALRGRWITGGEAQAATVGKGPAALGTPLSLAQSLLTALNHDAALPAVGDPGTTIDGAVALKAVTSMGVLYVTKDPPYRVLRIERGRSGSPRLPSLPPLPSLPSFPSPSSFAPAATGHPFAPAQSLAGSGTIDLPELSSADIDRLFQDLENDVKQLKDAVNTDVQFNLRGNAQVACSGGGCLVTANVTSSATSTNPGAKVTGGKASGQLIASVLIDGQPAGGCTTTAPLPTNGSGTISCEDPAAGPIFTTVQARKRAIAQAESRERGGALVPYTIQVTGRADVVAVATVQVEAMVRTLQSEAELAHLLDQLQDALPQPTVQPTPSRGPSARPSPEPSGQPSPPPVALPTRKPRTDCTTDPPPGAQKAGNGGWILNTVGPNSRAGRGTACLKAPLGGTKTGPKTVPVGMTHAVAVAKKAGRPAGEVARCHIVGAQLGGSNTRRDNLVPCWQSGVNVADRTNPQGMTTFENRSAEQINSRPSETMDYDVEPHYRSQASTVPFLITMLAVTHDRNGEVTWVDWNSLLNERVIGRRLVNLGD